MCHDISSMTGGWPNNVDDLKAAVLKAWDNVSVDKFIEFVRSYKQSLLVILSRDGDRHPKYA